MYSFGGIKKNDLWARVYFLLFAVFLFRVGSHIPIPFINIEELLLTTPNIFGNGIFDLVDLFSGGALTRFSLFSMGVMPYISSSIIIQLLGFIIPSIGLLKKEGQSGYKKLIQYTRFLTFFISVFQAIIISYYIEKFAYDNLILYYTISVFSLVCGSIFLMWLGEQITERGIGNGISLIIFFGIVSSIPIDVVKVYEDYNKNVLGLFGILFFIVLIMIMTYFVVYFESAQRKIVINYAKRQQGNKIFAAQRSYLPLKINIAGVLPTIFANGLIIFPVAFFEFLSNKFTKFGSLSNFFTYGKPLYMFVLIVGIVFFCFLYTMLIFNSKDTADNIKKTGGFISGMRPGLTTASFINKIVLRLTVLGALYIIIITVLPELLNMFVDVPFSYGGTSLLITVLVILDFINHIYMHMISQKYDKLLRGTDV